MDTEKNVAQLFIADDAIQTDLSALGTAVIPNVGSLVSQVADGDIFVMTPNNRLVDEAAANFVDISTQRYLKIVQRTGAFMIESDVIDVQSVKSYTITGCVPQAQQLDYIGSNGTAGSIDVANSNWYTVRLYVKPATIQGFMQQKIVTGAYKSDSTAIQWEIAQGLCYNLIQSYAKEVEQDIRFATVVSGVSVAGNDFAAGNIVTTVQGSEYIQSAVNFNYGAGVALAVGDFIRIAPATGDVVAVTDPVYRVVELTLATVTKLDRPIQEAGEVYAAAGGCEVILSATGLAANFGLKIWAQAKTFVPGIWHYDQTRWTATVDFDDATNATIVNATVPTPGVGEYEAVAQLELQLQAQENPYRDMSPAPTYRTRATALDATNGDYNMLILEYEDSLDTDLGGVAKSPKQLIIAIPYNANYTTVNAAFDVAGVTPGFVVLLDEWLVDDWAIPGITQQLANLT